MKHILYTYINARGFPHEEEAGLVSHVYGVIHALRNNKISVITFPKERRPRDSGQKLLRSRGVRRSVLRELIRDVYVLFYVNLSCFLKLFRFRKLNVTIYNRFVPYGWSVGLFAMLFRINLINEINAPIEETGASNPLSVLNSLNKLLLRASANLASFNICVSDALRQIIITYGVKPHKIHSYHNCVSDDFLTPPCSSRIAAAREALGISKEDLVVGMVAAFKEYHGLLELINILETYTDNKRIVLLLVGEPNPEFSRKFYSTLNETTLHVVHVGFVAHPKVKDLIDMMDICVELGRLNAYGSPLKLFEYGSRGKLVIFTDTPPVAEVIIHGENGLLVNKETMKLVLFQTFRKYGVNPAVYIQMGARLRDLVLSKYTWANYVDFILGKIR